MSGAGSKDRSIGLFHREVIFKIGLAVSEPAKCQMEPSINSSFETKLYLWRDKNKDKGSDCLSTDYFKRFSQQEQFV